MEVQLTDFENAAFSIFIVLLSRAIMSFSLNLYMPISKVDLNMHVAQKRNAARTESFYFRKNLYMTESKPGTRSNSASSSARSSLHEDQVSGANGYAKPKSKKLGNCFPEPPRPVNGTRLGPVDDEYELMTLEEIMLGKVYQDFMPFLLIAYIDYLTTGR